MTAAHALHKIVDDGLCLGCGLCAALAPDAVHMARGTDGDLRPYATADFTDEDMQKVSQTCPSLRVEGLPSAVGDLAPYQDAVWGPYYEMGLGYANQPDIRHQASTAGMLTMLAIALIETKQVDAIMHVKAADAPANFGVATLSRTKEEIICAAGSRYGPTATLVTIQDVLSSDERVAVIAKPCDLNALRNLAHIDPRVTETISFWLTMLCGGFQPDAAFHKFLSEHDVSADGLEQVRYRGYGCPGPTSLIYEDERQVDFHYLDFWGEDESQWSMPLRCKICPDGIGEAADIVAGDAWDGASPDRYESETDLGFNSVILRTKAGVDLYQMASDQAYITHSQDVDKDYMSRVQPHQVVKKLASHARQAGLAEAGSVSATLVNMREQALNDLLGCDEFEANKQGACERAVKQKMR